MAKSGAGPKSNNCVARAKLNLIVTVRFLEPVLVGYGWLAISPARFKMQELKNRYQAAARVDARSGLVALLGD